MADTFMVFRSSGRNLAIPSEVARQVVPMEQISQMPGTHGALLGLMPAGGRAIPVVNLASVAGLEEVAEPLALICEINSELLALPVENVIGMIRDEDAPHTNELLSEETLLGGYLGGGQRGQVLNPLTLLSAVQNRVLLS